MTQALLFIRRLGVALWIFAGMAARASDPYEWRVTIDVQMIAVSPESALKLAPALRGAATFEKAFAKIQQMIEREEADLVGWPVTIASGKARFSDDEPPPRDAVAAAEASNGNELATSESVNAARFPTEYLPPQVPQVFGPSGTLAQNFPVHPGEYATPTAFESRNLGVTLATEAVVSKDGMTIELSLRSEHSLLLGYQAIAVPNNTDGISATFYQPQICMAKNSARLTVLSGKRMLLGTFVEAKPVHKVLLFLLRAIAGKVSGKSSSL